MDFFLFTIKLKPAVIVTWWHFDILSFNVNWTHSRPKPSHVVNYQKRTFSKVNNRFEISALDTGGRNLGRRTKCQYIKSRLLFTAGLYFSHKFKNPIWKFPAAKKSIFWRHLRTTLLSHLTRRAVEPWRHFVGQSRHAGALDKNPSVINKSLRYFHVLSITIIFTNEPLLWVPKPHRNEKAWRTTPRLSFWQVFQSLSKTIFPESLN